ncbi:Cas10/Cmr2 second palm domain-containing protein [Rhabdothermincola sediminis]|uniref:Cas10/Cmr2 second palm domain-containing protein n=1 Tax=Rhabdothermincola sediminis TaxID=2751370 RepID=UPI001AA09717|nr:hypothetical protein [Rhabdothermincola sediminis]
MHLVLFETSGNQRYIFDTNKLRENLGASELTARAGTTWVLEAVCGLTRKTAPAPDDVGEFLQDRERNPPIESGSAVEVVVAASGKAMLLTQKRDDAERLVWQVTSRAMVEAPGLDVCGVISEPFDWSTTPIHEGVTRVHHDFGSVRVGSGGPHLRFPGVPIGARCATSGLPATELDRFDPTGTPAPRAAAIAATRAAAEDGRARMSAQVGAKVAKTLAELEAAYDRLDWLGVIHADGNGIGAVLGAFDRIATQAELLPNGDVSVADRNRAYVNALRTFSLGLNKLGISALRQAVTTLGDDAAASVVPIVIGGDDLTVLCDGRRALELAVAYLRAFEKCSGDDEVLRKVAVAASGSEHLGACAGVAIVKPHYPFSAAYDLTEALTASAKVVKQYAPTNPDKLTPQSCSAIDFHVLYDVGAIDLGTIRERMVVDNGSTRLYTRPYVVTEPSARPAGKWFKGRGWEVLEDRVTALQARDDQGRRLVPRSQTHDLRGGLFLGRAEAEHRFALLCGRYPTAGDLADARDPDGSGRLFCEAPDDGSPGTSIHRTSFLDAIEVEAFLDPRSNTATGQTPTPTAGSSP